MEQIKYIQNIEEKNFQTSDSNRFLACEEIVDELVEKGLPENYSPETFINKISKNYNISFQEARTCLKLAVKQLELSKKEENSKPEEKLYAQSGYFYPTGYSATIPQKADGMDSLSSLGSYNRLMFGIH